MSELAQVAMSKKLSRVSVSMKVAEKADKHGRGWPTKPTLSLESSANRPLPRNGKNRALIVSRMTAPGYIYFLADPRTPRHPRYIGCTANPVERARQHRNHPSDGNAAFATWKRQLRAEGLAPILVVIRELPSIAEARAAEWRLMDRWQRRGLADLSLAPTLERQGLQWRHLWQKRPA